MINARHVIIASIALAALSLISSVAMLVNNSPDEGGWGANSYGVRAAGLRAIHDTLDELGVAVERQVIPSPQPGDFSATYVIWNPMDSLIQAEPAHLDRLREWVRSGGRLVVTAATKEEHSPLQQGLSKREPVDLFDSLGLRGVAAVAVGSEFDGKLVELAEEGTEISGWRQALGEWAEQKPESFRDVKVVCRGDFENWKEIEIVRLPADEAVAVEIDDAKPFAQVTCNDQNGKRRTVAAAFDVGNGAICVVAMPQFASNRLLGHRDNSVLAARLMTFGRQSVTFDEFYHGLTLRGNALWLLTQRPYATMLIAVLVVAGSVVWRRAVFLGPPREEVTINRRSINEYLEAMSRFLLRSRGSAKFMLRELRSGLLWRLGDQFGLPPDLDDPERVRAAIARSDPKKAEQFGRAVATADTVLATPRPAEAVIIDALRKVNACLSN